MYIILLLLCLAAGVWAVATGLRRGLRARVALGLAGLVATVAFFCLLDFWGELLWFRAIGYERRFWTLVILRGVSTAGCGLAAALVVWFLTRSVGAQHAVVRAWPVLAALALGSRIGWDSWDELVLFLQRFTTGVADPILGRDVGFYFFVLPFLDRVLALLAVAVGIAGVGVGVGTFVRPDARDALRWRVAAPAERFRPQALVRVSVALALLLAAGAGLGIFHLLYSEWGVVAGPGWTDVHVRWPAYVVVLAGTLVLGAWGALRGARARTVLELRPLGVAWAGIAGLWLVALGMVPNLVQWLVVEPNEITFEQPYIAHNIEFTRRGFRLDEVEQRLFPATGNLTREMARRNEHLLSEVRLWDYRALASVYRQFQEIRLYYQFADVDIDRYRLGDRYRQVMVSARELELENLPAQSQTFVNRRFKYTHGYGITLAAVSDFTDQGLPNLLVKDIPPRTELPELHVEEPRIYYCELTSEPAVVNSTEAEFDYPRGDKNATIHYPGSGGVLLKNLWRKFVFGWKLDGTRFLLSSYPRAETRVMFHRQVHERVAVLAPFLALDDDPYVVLADGRLYWIIDAYTTSDRYPYSEPFRSRELIETEERGEQHTLSNLVGARLRGANWLRNSVKVVVDAFDGTVSFYVFEPDDPLLRAWRAVFPGLFRDASEMPAELRAHVRYPVDFLLAQGLVYAKYHMTDPEVFYNQEDLWVRATEKYHTRIQPVEPYYVMWQLPGSEEAEFTLVLPFTPKNRQVLIGWIAGLCDGENYGRFLAYKFPKDQRLLGPQQVETKIDQDRFLSGQLTLWDQRGSRVIRGNVLAIPIEDTLLYVEPIYLQAETAAYPELRLVAVMHGDRLSYAPSFEEALAGLFAGGEPTEWPEELEGESVREHARRAQDAFERYLELTGEGRLEAAARELESLRVILERIAGES